MNLFFRKSGAGQPLIILHGLFGISDNWATLAKKLAEHFTVYAVDLRNHGQSPHSDQWKYWIMSEDILELIENEKFAMVYIFFFFSFFFLLSLQPLSYTISVTSNFLTVLLVSLYL